MQRKDFFYELPPELIAQKPLPERDKSRLMVIDRKSGTLKHDYFYNICDYLNPGDLLILNDSKVFPARLYGKKRGGTAFPGVDAEILLLEEKGNGVWEAIVKPGRRLKEGAVIEFDEGISGEIIKVFDDGNRLIKFDYTGNIYEAVEKIGHMPLPPYITEKLSDGNKHRYNTVYSREMGSAAAPTAGLHFTGNIFENLKRKGIETAFVTLHVGLGTFRPVKTDNILEHKMHIEKYTVTEIAAQKINECRKRGGSVIAVGTTSCRSIESSVSTGNLLENEFVLPGTRETDIFIYPGYKFKIINGLITNFHLPESTLIMLVSAMLGREKTLEAYYEAIREKYRFFSFGDCMLIL